MAKVEFTIDCTQQGEVFPHFWEHSVGSGHAALALRADYQAQLKRCHDELGFRRVRFHGLLNDDMGTFLIYDDQPLYSFFNIDQIFDYLLSMGMQPLVELSFMPSGLSSGDKTVFHYRGNVTPPRDYDLWATLIQRLAEHWIARYGADEVRQWLFEVWNEPNLEAFGTGSQADYFKLYDYTARALKRVDAGLQVGGPATATNSWLPEFLAFAQDRALPVDFVSTHHYPTDALGDPGDDTLTQLEKSERSILLKQTRQAKAEAGDKPLLYTEWSSSSNPRDALHDLPYCAAFVTKTVMEARGLVEAYSYWTFSDIFEENYMPSMPFHGGFGLLTIHGVAKPVYRAFELLHGLGDTLLATTGTHATVDAWAVAKPGEITVLLANSALPRHPVRMEDVTVTLARPAGAPSAVSVQRIDDDHCNPRRVWEEAGSPEYPDANLLDRLHAASALVAETLSFENVDGDLRFQIALPPQGVAAVTVRF